MSAPAAPRASASDLLGWRMRALGLGPDAAGASAGATADTPLTRGSDERIDHARMIGQAQVVVAAESEQLAAVDARAHATRLAGLDLAPRTQSSGCGKRRQAGLE